MKIKPTSYEPLTPSELGLQATILQAVLTDPEIMDQVDDLHAKNERCAVVIEFIGGELDTGYTMNEEAVVNTFPFSEVAGALNAYDMTDSICFIFARDGRVSASVGGRTS